MGGHFFLLCSEFENYVIKIIPECIIRVRELRLIREKARRGVNNGMLYFLNRLDIRRYIKNIYSRHEE